MNDFKYTELIENIQITDIITIHYFEYNNNFYFPGEYHDFWEFLYVDKGDVLVMADEEEHHLQKGDIIFHKPNEFHNVRANGIIPPNLIVIAFQCDSTSMEFFHNKILRIGEQERNLLALIISEAKAVFLSPLNDPYIMGLEIKKETPYAGCQMIKLYLEQLLIFLIRKNIKNPMSNEIQRKSNSMATEEVVYHVLIEYLNKHIENQLTIDMICHDLSIGSSQIQRIFNEKHGCGIIRYFGEIKIKAAKEYIRQNTLNFTQISEKLGYSSVHYFSRQFKKYTNMTPSEYATSTKAITDRVIDLK